MTHANTRPALPARPEMPVMCPEKQALPWWTSLAPSFEGWRFQSCLYYYIVFLYDFPFIFIGRGQGRGWGQGQARKPGPKRPKSDQQNTQQQSSNFVCEFCLWLVVVFLVLLLLFWQGLVWCGLGPGPVGARSCPNWANRTNNKNKHQTHL